jgi:hypothetical protein
LIASSPVAFAQGASTVSPGQQSASRGTPPGPVALGHPEVRRANCISIAVKRPQGARREPPVILPGTRNLFRREPPKVRAEAKRKLAIAGSERLGAPSTASGQQQHLVERIGDVAKPAESRFPLPCRHPFGYECWTRIPVLKEILFGNCSNNPCQLIKFSSERFVPSWRAKCESLSKPRQVKARI